MVKGRRVPKEEAERTKRELQANGVLDESRQPIREEGAVIFPVIDDYDGVTVNREFSSFNTTPSFDEQAKSILSEDELEDFIGSYDVIGDIALIQLPEIVMGKAEELGEALLDAHPHLSTVRRRNTPRSGDYRLRNTAFVAGEDKTRTTHTEHGVDLNVDLNDVYFSPRLSTERRRIAEQVDDGEDVLVMFGGCGPYACIIAAHARPSSVTSVEWNPEGHKLAVENIERNHFEDVVSCVQGDVADIVSGLGSFDRVVMPAPHSASEYTYLLDDAVRSGGEVHLYRFQEHNGVSTEWLESVPRKVDILHVEHCGDKNPAVRRVCYDLRLATPETR